MNAAELAALAGVEVTSPSVELAAGQARAVGLLAALRGATTREDVAAEIAAALCDDDTIGDLAGLVRQSRGEWAGVMAQFRAVKGISADVRALARLVEGAARGLRVVRSDDVAPASKDEPPGWVTPFGYVIDSRGVWRIVDDETGDSEQVLTTPLWISGRMVDVETQECALRLRWVGWSGAVVDHVVDAVQVADSRAIMGLSARGLMVGSHNSREVCGYIDAALAANRSTLPIERTARRCGWFGDGFLLGDRWVGGSDPVTLRTDEGGQQIAAGIVARGSWDGWVEAIQRGADSPAVWLAVYASVASVLLDRLDIPTGFIVDWSGETSQGKTTVLRAAASVWGEPSQRGLLQSWSLTTSRAEGVAALLQHLPLCLDDTKQARRCEDVAALLYAHAFGQSKGRAQPGKGGQSVGLRVSSTWRSVMLSTGEAKATSFTEDAGARARTLCLSGSPMSSGASAQALTVGVLAHYGHLGERVILRLLDKPEQYAEDYRAAVAHYRAALEHHGAVAGRLAEPVALLHVARVLAEDVGLPSAPEGVDPVAMAIRSAVDGGRDADRPAAALSTVIGVAFSRPTSLYGRHVITSDGEPQVPHGGWIGAMAKGDAWALLDLRVSWVRDQLTSNGYDVEGTISRWAERGWLDGTGKRESRTARMDGLVQRVYRFRRPSVEAAGLSDD